MSLENHEIEKLRHIMQSFVDMSGANHPAQRLDKITEKIEKLSEQMHEVQIGLSNAQLVQRGVLWLGGIIGSSSIAMVITVVTGGN